MPPGCNPRRPPTFASPSAGQRDLAGKGRGATITKAHHVEDIMTTQHSSSALRSGLFLLACVALAVQLGCGSRSSSNGGSASADSGDPGNTGSGSSSSSGSTAGGGGTPLFNGRDLSGWHYLKGESLDGRNQSTDGRFQSKDGTLVIRDADSKGDSTTVRELWTTQEYNKDFVLTLEFKAANEAHAAVMIYNQPIPVGDFLRRGEQTHLKKFRNDDWNELEVTVKLVCTAAGRELTNDDKLDVVYKDGQANPILNGKAISPSPISLHVYAYPKVNGEALQPSPRFLLQQPRGRIGLRSGYGRIDFRNIRIRQLN